MLGSSVESIQSARDPIDDVDEFLIDPMTRISNTKYMHHLVF